MEKELEKKMKVSLINSSSVTEIINNYDTVYAFADAVDNSTENKKLSIDKTYTVNKPGVYIIFVAATIGSGSSSPTVSVTCNGTEKSYIWDSIDSGGTNKQCIRYYKFEANSNDTINVKISFVSNIYRKIGSFSIIGPK